MVCGVFLASPTGMVTLHFPLVAATAVYFKAVQLRVMVTSLPALVPPHICKGLLRCITMLFCSMDDTVNRSDVTAPSVGFSPGMLKFGASLWHPASINASIAQSSTLYLIIN